VTWRPLSSRNDALSASITRFAAHYSATKPGSAIRPARIRAITTNAVGIDPSLLRFHCTGCGNCCREPLLPITDHDLRRLIRYTGIKAERLVHWCSTAEIDLADEPENFVALSTGRRVMTLKHQRGGCVFLGADERCTVYTARPWGCHVFPFDTQFTKDGKLRRLELIPATDCPYELSGRQSVTAMRKQQQAFQDDVAQYHAKIAAFNQIQKQRKRQRRAPLSAKGFFEFLGLS
jgi:Fe-S-cluster containining protein